MNPSTFSKAEFIAQLVERGGKCLVGEWRGCKAEVVKYVDEKGQGRQFVKLDHTIEYGNPNGGAESCKLSERLPATIQKIEDVPVSVFTRGQTIVARIQNATTAKGANSAGCNFGEIFVLVD